MKTYRIEEFLSDYVSMDDGDLLKPVVLRQVNDIMNLYNSLGDYNHYFSVVGSQTKDIFFNNLTRCGEFTNIVNFMLKMLNIARTSLTTFESDLNQDNDFIQTTNFKHDFTLIKETMANGEKILYDIIPEKTIMVLSHNDIHALNIMKKPDYSKILVFDHEYSCYNFLGFDMGNYLVETFHLLDGPNYPYFKCFSRDFSALKGKEYFEIYLQNIDSFLLKNKDKFKDYPDFEEVVAKIKTQDYLLRMNSLSILLWFIFGIVYLNLEDYKNKNSFGYFDFAISKLNIYLEFIKPALEEQNI